MTSSIALFDFSHELSVQFHAGASDGGPNTAVGATMRTLHEMKDYATHLIVCLDKPPYFRTELFPEYKGQRERLPEWHAIYRSALEAVEKDGFSIAAVQGFESDDVMATLARHYYPDFSEIRLVTSDKDLVQCVNDRVTVHVRGRGGYEVRGLEWLAKSEKFGFTPKSARKEEGAAVTPEQIPLFLAITGDKSDNIPGVAGIGPVNAAELIRKCWRGSPLLTLAAITESMLRVNEAMAPVGKVPAVVTKWLAGCGRVGEFLKLTELRSDLVLDPRALLGGMAVAEPREQPYTIANLPPDPELERLEAEVAAAADVISAPPAPSSPPMVSWLSFRSLLSAQRSVDLCRHDPSSEYAQDLLTAFAGNLSRHQENGMAYTPAMAASAAYIQVKTPEEKRVIAALPKAPASGSAKSSASPAPSAPSPDASAATPAAADVASTPPTGPKACAGPVFTPPAATGGLALLRQPFPDRLISQLPKGTKAQNTCPPSEKRNCKVCGGWHHPNSQHLPYAGHAAVTDRLLEADEEWTWEPVAVDADGLPKFDATGGLWINLTVCGVTRKGYGHAAKKEFSDPGAREKEVIGDALRNAAMRFGAALELWHKGDLHGDE